MAYLNVVAGEYFGLHVSDERELGIVSIRAFLKAHAFGNPPRTLTTMYQIPLSATFYNNPPGRDMLNILIMALEDIQKHIKETMVEIPDYHPETSDIYVGRTVDCRTLLWKNTGRPVGLQNMTYADHIWDFSLISKLIQSLKSVQQEFNSNVLV